MKQKCLFVIMIVSLFFNRYIYAQPGIIACYPLDSNANDYSGHNYNGLLYNVTPTTDRNGNANSAYHFSGANSYIEIADSAFHLNSYTYSVWCKLTANPPSGEAFCVFGIGEAANQSILVGNNYWFNTYPGIGFVSSVNPSSSGQFCFSGIYPNLNQWYHLVVTRTPDSMKLYVDNIFECYGVTSYNPSYANSPSAARIGKRPGSISLPQYFVGDIDELILFNHALSASEIATIGSSCITTGINNIYSTFHSTDFYYDPASYQIKFDYDKLNNIGVDLIEVYNITGQRIVATKFPVETISVTTFSKGMFLIKTLNKSGQVNTSKIVIY